ncbi:MAG: hypothetical protein KC657_37160 [Myxococcales bacterium]|nr:hypothetical protein [Myxococcales bacterium]
MGRENNVREPLVAFCLNLEEARRSDDGRVRSAEELLQWLFRHDEHGATDLIFSRMPRAERGPVLTAWGIRGAKAALRDDDDKVRDVVHDALIAGDVDAASFEEGISAKLLIRWVPLTEWWSFWRAGKLTNTIVQKALVLARTHALFDDAWLLGALQARGGRLQGTDAIGDWLTKDQVVAWIRAIAESKDASPKGVIDALGWEVLLSKAPADTLLALLDSLAKNLSLVPTSIAPQPRASQPAMEAVNATVAAAPAPAAAAAAPAPAAGAAEPARPPAEDEAQTTKTETPEPAPVDAKTHAPESSDVAPVKPPPLPPSAPAVAEPQIPDDAIEDASHLAEDAPDSLDTSSGVRRDSGLPVAIPDIPAVDAGGEWDGDEPAESERLAQARNDVMAHLGSIDAARTEAPSKLDARPSALEWEAPVRHTPTPTDQITLGQGPKPRSDPRAPKPPLPDGAPQRAARLDPTPRKPPRPTK